MKHFDTRPLDDAQEAEVRNIKDAAQAFLDIIEGGVPSRERSLAVTNLEQAVFWAVRGLALQNG